MKMYSLFGHIEEQRASKCIFTFIVERTEKKSFSLYTNVNRTSKRKERNVLHSIYGKLRIDLVIFIFILLD